MIDKANYLADAERVSQTRTESPARTPLARLAGVVVERHRLVLLVSLTLIALCAVLGADVSSKLSSGGYSPEDSESAAAQHLLSDELGNGTPNLVLLVDSAGSVDDTAQAARGRALHDRVATAPGVAWAHSYWSTNEPALKSTDGTSALILVRLDGDENAAQEAATALVAQWQSETADSLEIRPTGEAQVNADVVEQSEHDLIRAELLGAPLIVLILLLVFGSPVAALLPVAVGAVAVVLTTALLEVMASVTDVSQFALNITTALGFGLAVDYSLFTITRYREELDNGRSERDALVHAVATSGRTVLFSAVTVAASLAALLVFPLYFLRSLAYAAIPVVLIAGLASVTVLPALLYALRRWVFRFGITGRRGTHRTGMWSRWATAVMRRPLLTATPVVVLLLVLATPFLGANFGLTDYRVLPVDAPAHQAAATLEEQFPDAARPTIEIAVDTAASTDVEQYARSVSELPDVEAVVGPDGIAVDGTTLPAAMTTQRNTDTITWLTVALETDRYSDQAQQLVEDIRAIPVSGGTTLVGGDSAVLVDTTQTVVDGLGWAALIIGLTTSVLLFLFTGGILVPIKALVLNLLSLTASFGAMVFVFQEGNLQWLVGDFTATGYLEVTIPVLMFCIAFGLSMDYEVFVLSRIREAYDATGDNAQAVATGLERTGKLVTAAALVIACVLGVLATSGLSLLKLLGVGLALAVLVDAVLIRSVLVPAFMKLAGRANWWAPAPLARLYTRFGLRDDPAATADERQIAFATGSRRTDET